MATTIVGLYRHERSTVGAGTAGIPPTDATTGRATPASHGPRATTEAAGERTFEVVEEELDVAKREVQRGGVRVRSYLTERPVEEEVRLRGERIDVERRPTDRPLAKGEVERAFEERTVAMTERSEEAVVGKRARVVEEVVLSKRPEERTERVRDTVRRTDVEVERADDVLTSDRERFLTHHRGTLGGTERDDAEREPAYRYGIDLANHPDYRGRPWNEVAPEAREHWVHQNGETWLEYEPAVRFSFERAIERRRR